MSQKSTQSVNSLKFEVDLLFDKLASSTHAAYSDTDRMIEGLSTQLSLHDLYLSTLKTTVVTKKCIVNACQLAGEQWKEWQFKRELYSPLGIRLGIEQTEQQAINAHNKKYQPVYQAHQSKHVETILKKLKVGLQALLEQPAHSGFDEAKLITLFIIMNELLKLKITQLEALESVQQIKKQDLKLEVKKLKERKKAVNYLIHHRPKSLSSSTGKKLSHSYLLFKTRENRFHFNQHLKQIEPLSIFAGYLKSTVQFASSLGSHVPALSHSIGALAPLLTVLPIISQAFVLYPLAVKNIKAWLKKKTAISMLSATSIFALGVFTTVAVALSFPFALGLVAAITIGGTIAGNIIPWLKLNEKIKRLKKSHAECDTAITEASQSTLSTLQRQVLLLGLEKLALAHETNDNISDKQVISNAHENALRLEETKHLIITGNTERLANDPNIKKLMAQQNCGNFSSYLAKNVVSHQNDINRDIVLLSKKRALSSLALVSSLISVAAICLFFIPTPITLLIASGLILVSASINIGLKTYKNIKKNKTTKPVNALSAVQGIHYLENAHKNTVKLTPAYTNSSDSPSIALRSRIDNETLTLFANPKNKVSDPEDSTPGFTPNMNNKG